MLLFQCLNGFLARRCYFFLRLCRYLLLRIGDGLRIDVGRRLSLCSLSLLFFLDNYWDGCLHFLLDLGCLLLGWGLLLGLFLGLLFHGLLFSLLGFLANKLSTCLRCLLSALFPFLLLYCRLCGLLLLGCWLSRLFLLGYGCLFALLGRLYLPVPPYFRCRGCFFLCGRQFLFVLSRVIRPNRLLHSLVCCSGRLNFVVALRGLACALFLV